MRVNEACVAQAKAWIIAHHYGFRQSRFDAAVAFVTHFPYVRWIAPRISGYTTALALLVACTLCETNEPMTMYMTGRRAQTQFLALVQAFTPPEHWNLERFVFSREHCPEEPSDSSLRLTGLVPQLPFTVTDTLVFRKACRYLDDVVLEVGVPLNALDRDEWPGGGMQDNNTTTNTTNNYDDELDMPPLEPVPVKM